MNLRGNFIDGEWCAAATGGTRDRRNPADTRELVATAPDSGADDVRAAIGAVERGWRRWAETSAEQRSTVLTAAAEIVAHNKELAAELVREEGKTLAEAVNETLRTAANLRFYAAEALRISGVAWTPGSGGLTFTTRQPIGIVAAITPWNFPLSIAARKLGPALAAGNGVVFKPSEVTPLMGQRLVESLLEAGLPAGAIALVHGGAEAGAALVGDSRVAAITFTGSYTVGASIHRAVAPEQRTQLEMGGKNPLIVLDDADLERAADLIVQGAFGLAGQACTGTSRVVVHDGVHDQLLALVIERAESRRIGSGLEDGVHMGPLATEEQLAKVRGYLDIAITDGGQVRTGYDPLTDPRLRYGHFVSPAVVSDVERTHRLARDEVFGPVLAFLRVGSFDEAVEVANDSEYGLSSAIVTRDIGRAMDFAKRVDSGLVKVNQPTTGMALNAPFGGVKRSSTQTFKEQAGDTMMHFYTIDKTVYLSP